MAIIKTKIREKSYVQIDKTGIDDKRITLSATGLLCYLIGRPSNWDIIIEHLKTVKKDGRDSVKSALVELREYEYCHYFELREKGIVRETFYLVFETPTAYEEVMREYIDIPEGYTLLYKPVAKKRKEIIMEEKKPTFITINKNKEKVKEKQYAYNELDLIKILFEMYNINFTDENIKELQNFLAGLSLGREEIKSNETILKSNVLPKTEFQLSAKNHKNDDNIFNSELYPKTASPLTANRSLIIKDNNKINIKNHDHEEEKKHDLDFFENLFKEFKINFTKTNQESVKKLLKSFSSQKQVEEYLRETYNNILATPGVKDPAGLFSVKIGKGERQVISKAAAKEETKNEEKILLQEKSLTGKLNHLLEYAKRGYKTPIEVYQDMKDHLENRDYDKVLGEKYLLIIKNKFQLE